MPSSIPVPNSHKNLLTKLQTSYKKGLSQSQISTLRQQAEANHHDNHSNVNNNNTIRPPLNCPSWACILLPCLNHLPSMKLYHAIRPDDAEVWREARSGRRSSSGRIEPEWISYDASSLLPGDIVRLTEGDCVPADCAVLTLGMVHVEFRDEDGGGVEGEESESTSSTPAGALCEELLVDARSITGRARITSIRNNAVHGDVGSGNSTMVCDPPVRIVCGSRVVQGSCIAVVTDVGSQTLWARLMDEGRWPPPKRQHMNGEDEDMEEDDIEEGQFYEIDFENVEDSTNDDDDEVDDGGDIALLGSGTNNTNTR